MNTPNKGGPGPVIWLVLGIPALTLVAGLWTLAVAIRVGESDAVADTVRQTAQVQDRDLGVDMEASRQGLRFELGRAGTVLQLTQIGGTPLAHAPLQLQFVHPLHADADHRLEFTPDPLGWRATLPSLGNNDWHLELRDARGQWRLVGRWPRNAERVTLAPALGP